MRRKFLLFVMFSFVLFGCGFDTAKIRILAMGKPYLTTGEELCKKQYYTGYECGILYRDLNLKNISLKMEVIAVPLETSFSMIENSSYDLRECSYMEEIVPDSKHGFGISVFPFKRDDTQKGFFVLNINKMKKLGWLDKDNKLTKSICLSPPFGYKNHKSTKELDSIALKNGLDEMDAQEDEK
jgi:hypothetical protein